MSEPSLINSRFKLSFTGPYRLPSSIAPHSSPLAHIGLGWRFLKVPITPVLYTVIWDYFVSRSRLSDPNRPHRGLISRSSEVVKEDRHYNDLALDFKWWSYLGNWHLYLQYVILQSVFWKCVFKLKLFCECRWLWTENLQMIHPILELFMSDSQFWSL